MVSTVVNKDGLLGGLRHMLMLKSCLEQTAS
jgi:hypothetical protein